MLNDHYDRGRVLFCADFQEHNLLIIVLFSRRKLFKTLFSALLAHTKWDKNCPISGIHPPFFHF